VRVCSPRERIKPSVECCAAVKLKDKQYAWCGLSTGEIQIVDFDSTELKQRLQVRLPAANWSPDHHFLHTIHFPMFKKKGKGRGARQHKRRASSMHLDRLCSC